VLQGVHTTLVLALPQIGFALAPHIQLEKVFLFLGSMARGLGTVQLFPARYLYPDAPLGGLANMPAPIFADLLAHHGRVAYPCVDCEPDPWRVLARFGNGDRYCGYPFRAAGDSMQDFTLHDQKDSDRLFLPLPMRLIPALVRDPPYSKPISAQNGASLLSVAPFRAERLRKAATSSREVSFYSNQCQTSNNRWLHLNQSKIVENISCKSGFSLAQQMFWRRNHTRRTV
jgi:hypothetical protein